MANLSKERRDRMIAKLEDLKKQHNDDASIAALNEIENALREKKYGLVWEEHSEAVDDMLKENIPVLIEDPERRLCKDSSLPWNFIIEGDNLQALYLLEKTHSRKVDCIYIDPPYNTGARDWKYNNDYVDGNDQYRHSKWLSMMRARLLLAKRLLNPQDSVLICTIDEKEFLRLGCLLEEVFPEATVQMVSTVNAHASTARLNEFNRNNEFIFFVMIGDYRLEAIFDSKSFDEGDVVNWRTLRRGDLESKRGTSKGGKAQFYPIYVNKKTGKIEHLGEPLSPSESIDNVPDFPDCIPVFPIRDDGTEMNWGLTAEALQERLNMGYAKAGKYTPNKPQKYPIQYLQPASIRSIENGYVKITGYADDGSVIAVYDSKRKVLPKTQWDDPLYDARDYGTKTLKNIIGDRFDFPKSIYAVRDCIKLFVANKPNSTIVDFFAGSGTTMHAVNILNAEDNGHRKCIMVTNNEISEEEQKLFESQGIHKGDAEWESRGIAKYVTWPRTICSVNGVDINGEPLKGNYIGTGIPMSDGFRANVKYMKCDWTPRKPDDYLLSNALCLHVKELIELQTAKEVDGVKTVLILSKSDYKRIFDNPDSEAAVESVWVNENLVFSAAEMRKLKAKHFRYIPREYFSQELKEVGEYV